MGKINLSNQTKMKFIALVGCIALMG